VSTFAAALLIAANTAFPDDVVIVTIDPQRDTVLFTVQRGDREAHVVVRRSEIDAADGHYADLGAQAIAAVRDTLEAYQNVSSAQLLNFCYVTAGDSGVSDLLEVDSE
jgi:hypothetical protein